MPTKVSTSQYARSPIWPTWINSVALPDDLYAKQALAVVASSYQLEETVRNPGDLATRQFVKRALPTAHHHSAAGLPPRFNPTLASSGMV